MSPSELWSCSGRFSRTKGPAEPNDTETETASGVIEVKTCADGSDMVDAKGPSTHGIRPKMSRGTASHNTEVVEKRLDLFERAW